MLNHIPFDLGVSLGGKMVDEELEKSKVYFLTHHQYVVTDCMYITLLISLRLELLNTWQIKEIMKGSDEVGGHHSLN